MSCEENEELVLKDLCARLPYDVKIHAKCFDPDTNTDVEKVGVLSMIDTDTVVAFTTDDTGCYIYVTIHEVKPYLFPLSSITEEQSMELFKLFGISLVDSIDADYIKINECTGITFFLNKGFDVETHLDKLIDWLNKNHFDWRDLIPMGLALDATDLNIY
jgi:hypothetical protein